MEGENGKINAGIIRLGWNIYGSVLLWRDKWAWGCGRLTGVCANRDQMKKMTRIKLFTQAIAMTVTLWVLLLIVSPVIFWAILTGESPFPLSNNYWPWQKGFWDGMFA